MHKSIFQSIDVIKVRNPGQGKKNLIEINKAFCIPFMQYASCYRLKDNCFWDIFAFYPAHEKMSGRFPASPFSIHLLAEHGHRDVASHQYRPEHTP
jgi:hypothetical protein